MFDPLLFLTWLIHMSALAGAGFWMAKRFAFPREDIPFVVFIVFWTSLVLGGHFSSLFLSLNSIPVFAVGTLVGLAVLYALLTACSGQGTPLVSTLPTFTFISFDNPERRRLLARLMMVSAVIVTLCAFFVVFMAYPCNADSVIYRLPRAFWYVSNASFLQPFDSLDRRLTFYPLNGVALYVPFVLYGLPGIFHNLPSPFFWLLIAYTTYRFARSFGADRLLACMAAWIIAMTPNIFAQSVSTNDEIHTAASLLVALFMGWRFLTSGRQIYFFLMFTTLGLSIGTKLHIIFLLPTILIALYMAVRYADAHKGTWALWGKAIGLKTALTSILFGAALGGSFLVYNYLSCGRWYFFSEFASAVFNLRASLHGMFQNLIIYLAQMTLAPIADLDIWPFTEDRQAFNTLLNAITNPFIKPFINTDPSFYHYQYRFVGVTIPTSVRFVEFSLWAGFAWLLWPFHYLTLRQDKNSFSLKPLFLLFVLTPLLWLFLWCATTLYMEGTATYFSFYLTAAAPACIFLFLKGNDDEADAWWNKYRPRILLFVAITNLLIVTNILLYSGFRSIPDIIRAQHQPYDWLMFDQKIINTIRAHDKIRIAFTHEKMPYFSYMKWNPTATYLDPYTNPKDVAGTLQILPASGLNTFGFMPIKIPGKPTVGMTYLGLIRGIGREAIFAYGDGVERKNPKESDYIFAQIAALPSESGFDIFFTTPTPAGLNAEDHFEFSYEITSGSRSICSRDWDKSFAYTCHTPFNPNDYQMMLTIKVRSDTDHHLYTTQTFQVLGPGQWLPEGPEY